MQIIALVGFKGSGKDTAGNYLVKNHGFKSFSFAESLKDTLASIFCWDRGMLSGDTAESRIWRETVDDWWADKLGIPGFTPRMAMQNIGTDLFRKHFNYDIWILNIERKLTLLPNDAKVVLTDGRFPNELNLTRKFGGKVFRVKRGNDPEWWHVAKSANGFVEYSEDVYFSNIPGGGVEAVRRNQMETIYKIHESEWAWIGQPIDAEIDNNADFDHLYHQTKRICIGLD